MHQRSWQERIGNQRDWIWRGWQTRYSYLIKNATAEQTPLILIHGFGASIEHWRHNIPVLSQQYPVYALDLLGFGASRKADTQYTVELWVEQVHDFWSIFIGEPVVLVGNSVGSLVCMSLAAIYPEMVKAIVMLSLPDISIRQTMIPSLIQPVVTSLENLIASPLLIKTLLKIVRKPSIISRWAKIAYADQNAVNHELIQILSAPAYDRDAEKTLYKLSQGVRKANFAPAAQQVLPRLTIPMLLIWGLQDRMVPPKLASFFASLNEKIDLIELDQMGHCPHDESPAKFNQILLDWLERII
ncbi:MAG: alpha/beta fold hydrolase [Xenococcus sp. MO_188.B8]|nr:alpha/beta fold hydrolase [Xenococcus sp. MO_188.B8]